VGFCYVTTVGRVTGRRHRIEIWFGISDEGVAYLLSGGGRRSDWVRNLEADPAVTIAFGRPNDRVIPGRARVVTDPDEDGLARRLLASKYQGWTESREMSTWARTALPVAIERADE